VSFNALLLYGNTRTHSAHNRYNIDPKELSSNSAGKAARRGEDIV
jgi:hypothetical protein